ncbi:MAG TPA: hypothetical protein VN911_07595 [Candidatus Acidoferrum sp.]|nr:hypothetical protein [Candidatus Acidoferrum sp.]
MSQLEALRSALEHYQQQREQKVREFEEAVRTLDLMIWQLKRDLGEVPEGEAPAVPASPPLSSSNGVPGRPSVSIKPDEFFRMNQTDAARAYLKKVGHSIPFDDLVAALRKGGAKLGGADPKKTLYVSLARNPRKEFVWPSKDFIGLDEFYADRTEK